MRSARRRSSAARSDAQVLDHVGADGVHDVLRVALEHRHEGLDAVELRAPLRPEHGGREAVLAHGVDQALEVVEAGHAGEQLARVDGERAGQIAHHAGQVRPQPRHAAELQRVRDLVQRDPAQEAVGVGVELRRRVAEVRRHEQQPRRRVGVEHRELVLAHHAPGQEAGDRAGLEAEHGARGGAGHAAQRARALGGLRGGGFEHAADRGEVRVDPRLAVDRLGDRQHPRGRHEPRVAADERLGLVGRAHQRLERLGVARGLESGDPFGDLGCEVPIDHPPRMAGRPLRFLSAAARAPAPRGPRAERAATIGATAVSTSSGASSGPGQPTNATCPPASRTISWPAATSTARERRSVTIPSSRPAATWHSDTAIAPIARSRCAASASASPASATQRGSADSTPSSSSRPRTRCSGSAGSSGTPLRRAPPPRSATHSSPAPKSCTNANCTSAIVGPSATAIESA